ncbi:MAG TPA: hypothetical protein VIJ42_10705 [Stellaceae bacterium]
MTAGDLTTLDNVKGWLSPPLTATADDQLLARLITAASRFIQTWLNRAIAARTYVETRDGDGGARLVFANAPVTAVASVTVDGRDVPPAGGTHGHGYLFDPSMLYLRGHRLSDGVQNVVVSYTAGYDATPPDIEQACIELVVLRYKERDRIGQVSKNLAGEIVAFSQKDMPADVATLIGQYRRNFTP